MTIGVLNQALDGIYKNQRRFEIAAGDLTRAVDASPDAAPADPADAVARMLVARRGLEACITVAQTGDELLGTVIDLLA